MTFSVRCSNVKKSKNSHSRGICFLQAPIGVPALTGALLSVWDILKPRFEYSHPFALWLTLTGDGGGLFFFYFENTLDGIYDPSESKQTEGKQV